METVLVRAPESINFGHESPEKPCKSRKKSAQISLGARCRRFESCHSDQKSNLTLAVELLFCLMCQFGSVLQSKSRFAYRRYHRTKCSYPVIPTIGALRSNFQTLFLACCIPVFIVLIYIKFTSSVIDIPTRKAYNGVLKKRGFMRWILGL